MSRYSQARAFSAKSSRSAFTLVELLCVIVVLGILGAIIMVGVSRVRIQAEATTCTSNLRSLHPAIMAYSMETGGQFPDIMVRNPQGTAWVQWWKVIAAYMEVSNPNRFPIPGMQCPATTQIAIERLTVANAGDLPNYGLNFYLGRYQYDASNPIIPGETVRVSMVQDPSNTLLVGDVGVGATSTCAFMNTTTVAFQGDKHPGGSNLLWVDGHVSTWEGVEKLGQPPYSPGGQKDVWTP
jgi:prepilin-type N-terminal cleavage/methylation domain-containing protein/prepilin-type processing-associated H-X9-DG protein